MSRRCATLYALAVAAAATLLVQGVSGLVLWLALPHGGALHAAMHWKWIARQTRALLGGGPAAGADCAD